MNLVTPLTSSLQRADTWPDEENHQRWVAEPRRFAPALDSLLVWAESLGASRIAFQTGKPVTLRIHGRKRRATLRSIDHMGMVEIANHLYGADGSARLENGRDFDVSYAISLSRTSQLRFRVNATPTMTQRRDGANLVLRPIPDLPPPTAAQNIEPEILEAIRPKSGLVVVAGATGSGKSTLLGGVTLDLLLDPNEHVDIGTAEAPIEFLLDKVESPSGSTINQSEIPRHLPSFEAFVRGIMRRELTHAIVGECRDSPTMAATIHAAMAGSCLYTTLHTDTVALVIQRATAMCPAEERDNLVSALAQALRLVINQRLIPSADGRRTAIREYVVFNRSLRMKLLHSDVKAWPTIVSEAVENEGQTFERAIHRARNEGRITEETAIRELRRDA